MRVESVRSEGRAKEGEEDFVCQKQDTYQTNLTQTQSAVFQSGHVSCQVTCMTCGGISNRLVH